MCGIFGYIGAKPAKDVIIEGLSALEYRGYDSAGIAVIEDNQIKLKKKKGKIAVLKAATEGILNKGSVGIGHTRWATHGEPSDQNSHPHLSENERFCVVHNGIIENYLSIKQELMNEGVVFKSETDTEVIVQLIEKLYKGDFKKAVREATARLTGSFALGVLSLDNPDTVIATAKDSPLIVGSGEGEAYIASDVNAVLPYTHKTVRLAEREIAVIKADGTDFFDENLNLIKKEINLIDFNAEASKLGKYESYMLKEIEEIPQALKNTLRYYKMKLDPELKALFKKIKKITVVACGTAYHAGVVGKYLIEKLARVPVEAEIASEFRYKNPIIDSSVLTVVISQSGETADTIAALKTAKSMGSAVLAVTNVQGCSINTMADHVYPTFAGPEIAVASTKAYNCQLMVMYILANQLRYSRKMCTKQEYGDFIKKLGKIPPKAKGGKKTVKTLATKFREQKSVFFLGRGLDYALAMEGSLKLKEISYVHSEAYAMGELKHGTLALIEKGTLVIANMTQKEHFDKALNGLSEVKARGANVVAIVEKGTVIDGAHADYLVEYPVTEDIFAPLAAIVPAQLFAYYMARARGCNADKPRNLAKSVTVE